MTDADPRVYFSQRLRVVVHRSTLRTVLRGIVITYPVPIFSMAAIALLALVARESAVLGLLLFPLISLARAQMRNEKGARAAGVVSIKIDTTKIPDVAEVKAGEGGLSVEGMNLTISRRSLLRGAVDESGTTVFVETKRDLPNFTFSVDDADEGHRLVGALGLVENRTPTKAPIPELLKRGALQLARVGGDTPSARSQGLPRGADAAGRAVERLAGHGCSSRSTSRCSHCAGPIPRQSGAHPDATYQRGRALPVTSRAQGGARHGYGNDRQSARRVLRRRWAVARPVTLSLSVAGFPARRVGSCR